MKVIIPAAGAGTRLRPHTHTTPKALVQVAGKPILGHILDRLSVLDVDGQPVLITLDDTIVIPPVYIVDTASIKNSVIGPFVSIAGGSQINQSIIQDTIINENARVENVFGSLTNAKGLWLLSESLIGENAIVSGRYSRLNVGDSSQIELL